MLSSSRKAKGPFLVRKLLIIGFVLSISLVSFLTAQDHPNIYVEPFKTYVNQTINVEAGKYALNGQDVPNGVTYKRASKAVDSEAKSSLELMLKEPTKAPAWFVGNLVTVGPTLWKEIDPTSDSRFGDTGRFMLMIQTSRPFTVPGGVLRTEAAREAFWDALWKLHPELANASVRKAKASELSYYWAMIPYDIAEPFFTLDAGEKQFIVNIIYDKKEISSVWVDLVGNLERLARRIE